MLKNLKKRLRNSAEKMGYTVIHRSVAPWGLSLSHDLHRLRPARSIKTIIDAGANVGQTAQDYSKNFPNARILSLEPVQSTFERLTQNVADLNFVTPLQLALGDTTGTAAITVFDNSTINSLVRDHNAQRFGQRSGCESVRVTTLDDLAAEQQLEHIDLLKLDLEGGELAALRGAERMMSEQSIDFIWTEFNALSANERDECLALSELNNLLRPFGYRFIQATTEFVRTDLDFYVNGSALFCGQWAVDQ